MKKVIFTLAIVAIGALSASAQKEKSAGKGEFQVGAGITAAIPVSGISASASFGIGADVTAQYGIADQVKLTGDAGYIYFLNKSGITGSQGIIPIRVGVRYYPAEKFYVAAKGGIAIYTVSFGGVSASTTGVAYAGAAGYQITEKFDVSASYEGLSKNGSIGWVGIRFGYNFK